MSILLPVYNNARYLPELARRLVESFANGDRDFEVLLIDDGSQDHSWRLICEIADRDSRFSGYRFSRNFGQHSAIAAALERARGDYLVLMDADLQDQPEDIQTLLAPVEDGTNDIVYSFKGDEREGLVRSITSRLFHAYVARATGSAISAKVGTFRAFTRTVANELMEYRERAIVYGPLMHSMGYRFCVREVRRAPRIGSASSYSFSKRLALAMDALFSYSLLPQRLLLGAGAIIVLLSSAYLGVVVIQYLMGGDILPDGLTLLITINLLMLGVITASIGLLASYVFRVHREVLARPRFHVQEATESARQHSNQSRSR